MIIGADAIVPEDATLAVGMPAAQYHADPCPEPSLSSSLAKKLLSGTARKAMLDHPRLNPRWSASHDEKFDIGTVGHAMLLEDDESRIAVIDANDWRTNAAKTLRDAARAEGKTAILRHQYDDAKAMADEARRFLATDEVRKEIGSAWDEATSEVTIQWREGDAWLRCRPDRLTYDHRICFDYKTTEDASPTAFGRTMAALGYPFQSAFYRRGIRALGGDDPAWIFLAQETEYPYECSLHGCDPGLRVIAEAQVERAIGLWRTCLAQKAWPGYGGKIHWHDAPVWMQKEHEEQQAMPVGAR